MRRNAGEGEPSFHCLHTTRTSTSVPEFVAATGPPLKRLLPPTATMTIELTKEIRADAIASIQRYFEKNMEEPIGNIGAGALLGFFLEEIGPTIYNKAVTDVQERLQQRISELDFDVHEDEFQYWKKYEVKSKPRK